MSLRDEIAKHVTQQKAQRAERNAELAANYRDKSEPKSLTEAIQQTYPGAKTLNQMNAARRAKLITTQNCKK